LTVNFFRSLLVYLLNSTFISRYRFHVTDNVTLVYKHEVYQKERILNKNFFQYNFYA